jgi:hypothetical protein
MLPYKCNVCDTYFKYKRQCDEHVITCTLADKRLKERCADIELKDDLIPNPRLMYELLKIALSKCAKLEQEVEHLKKTAYKERRQIDVMDYLHKHVQDVGEYNTFMNQLRNIQQCHLEAVFNGNIVDGVIALVQDYVECQSNDCKHLPFVSFSHKPGQIYVYKEEEDVAPQWSLFGDKDMAKTFDILSNRFIGAYSAWVKTVPELNEHTEESQNRKVVMFKKVLGTYLSDDFKYQKFKSWLYNHVKRDAKSIVEYEF